MKTHGVYENTDDNVNISKDKEEQQQRCHTKYNSRITYLYFPTLFTLVSLIAIVQPFLVLLHSAFSVIPASFCVHLFIALSACRPRAF